jgi:hypothetical protein
MSFEVDNTLIQSISENLIAAGWLGAALFSLYVIYRTRSLFLIRFLVWRLMFSKESVTDEKLLHHLNEQTSVMHARFMWMLPVHSLPQLHALSDWTRAKNVTMREIGWLQEFFDFQTLQFRQLPPIWRRLLLMILLMISALSFSFVGQHWFGKRAYFRLTESKAGFSATTGDVRRTSLSEDFAAFTLEDCDDVAGASRAGFSPKDALILCHFLNSKERETLIKSTLEEQKRLALGGTMLLLIFLSFSVLALGRLAAAQKLVERLHAPDDSLAKKAGHVTGLKPEQQAIAKDMGRGAAIPS